MKIQFKGMKFLSMVLIVYVILLIIETPDTLLAIEKSASILLSLLPLFLLIIMITALINYFLKPKQIIKHFGKDSGAKGIFYAVVGGIISHGPMYAWYGMLADMRSQGLKDGLIVTFMYARAIKLPLLPFMVDLFGLLFAIIITIYILIAAVLQGKIIDILEKSND